MSLTYLQAMDEVFGVANAAFVAAADAQEVTLGYIPAIYWPDGEVAPPDTTQIYGDCSFSVVTEHQASLTKVGGVSIYETVALFAIRLFAPKQDVGSLRIAETIGIAVKNAFRAPSPSGEVWFRDQKLSQVKGTTTRNQVNLTVVCTFKTIQ